MNHNFISSQLLRKQNEIWDEFDSTARPELLLHYTCPNGFRGIIESGEIWCTDIRDVNDPREGDYGLDVIQSVVDRNRTLIDEEFTEVILNSKSLFGLKKFWSVYIACFCSSGEQPYMWSTYACDRTGFAIGFNYDTLISGASGGKRYAVFRVLYDRQTQERKIAATLDHAIAMDLTMNLVPEDRRRFWMEEVAVALIVCASRFKHPKWCSEQEFRLSVTDPPDVVKFDAGGKSRIRVRIVRSAVTQVIRGTRSGSELDTVAIRDLLNGHRYRTDVKIVDAQR